MPWLLVLLILLTLFLQWPLWFGEGGWTRVWQQREAVIVQREENQRLLERNRALEAEVLDLRSGTDAVEERARRDFGMIKENEIFFMPVPADSSRQSSLVRTPQPGMRSPGSAH